MRTRKYQIGADYGDGEINIWVCRRGDRWLVHDDRSNTITRHLFFFMAKRAAWRRLGKFSRGQRIA